MTSIRNLDGVSRSNAWRVDNPKRIQVLDGFNARQTFAGIKELAEDILENGVLDALWVRRDRANEEQPFILIDGERRMRALTMLFESDPDLEMPIPVNVFDVDEEEAEDLMAKANLEREDFLPSEKVTIVQRYRKRGLSTAKIAKRLGMSTGWVDQMITLAGASKSVKAAMDEGKITNEAGLMIARKTKAADQRAALDKTLALAGGSKKRTSKAAAQVTGTKRRPGKKAVVQVVRELAGSEINGDSMTVKQARKLIIMALNYAAGEADQDALVKACRKGLKLKTKEDK
jgi:ParB/RepB/Spo0J family partition protein